ncbi:MAG: polysaccharide deacetylase family protein [Frankiales bacterium]|nr:polysaccharide deacetylase family protein [Frankiales bacterium]
MRPSSAAARRVIRMAREPKRYLASAVARVHHGLDDGGVALTFDDGPQPGSTDLVLDLLAGLEVRATFFCVGRNALQHPDLVQRMQAEGHAVGSHSFSHPHPAKTSWSKLAREYAEGRRAVSQVLGHDTALFRPPHGHISIPAAGLLRVQGLDVWLWTVDPEDWRPGVRPPQIEAVVSRAASGDVVLMHDWIEQPWAPEALDRSATVTALPHIVRAIRNKGLLLDRVAVNPPR